MKHEEELAKLEAHGVTYPLQATPILALIERTRELEAALRPLALCAATSMWSGVNPDNQYIYGPQSNQQPQPKGLTLADVFRARRAFGLLEDKIPCLAEGGTLKNDSTGKE